MKKRIVLIISLFSIIACSAQTDSLYYEQQQIEVMRQEVQLLKSNMQRMTRQLNGLQTQIDNLSSGVDRKIDGQKMALDSISKEVYSNAESFENTSAALGERINQADNKTDDVAHICCCANASARMITPLRKSNRRKGGCKKKV